MLVNAFHARRLGRLVATPEVLAVIPSSVLGRALRAHAYAGRVEGRPFRTRHGSDGLVFRLETTADRSETAVCLEIEG